mgnify:CR=1 FL=1
MILNFREITAEGWGITGSVIGRNSVRLNSSQSNIRPALAALLRLLKSVVRSIVVESSLVLTMRAYKSGKAVAYPEGVVTNASPGAVAPSFVAIPIHGVGR